MFLCELCYKTLILLQDIVLVMEEDSGSGSNDFVEEDTEK